MTGEKAHVHKKGKTYKIEGADFLRVKAAKEALDHAEKVFEAKFAAAREAYSAAHEKMWEQVRAAAGAEVAGYQLDTEYEESGVYFAKPFPCPGCGGEGEHASEGAALVKEMLRKIFGGDAEPSAEDADASGKPN